MSAPGGELAPGLHTAAYVYEPRHALLASDAWRADGPNIGARGANLTIAVLSLNRAPLTRRLLDSVVRHVPGFAGEVLIVDNGSAADQLEQLRDAAAGCPLRVRVVALDRNYGVAGGRNRAFAQAATDWVLSLDNDIYLIADPLPAIQRDIALLGCHFLNVPLLDRDGRTVFALGGHLYAHVAAGEIGVGGGSVFQQGPAPAGAAGGPFLSTFLFGGAGVLNKATFEQLGGFDEALFIGFEDTDFSLRLFQRGIKVGNTSVPAFVHDHPPPQADDDREYERRRFAREVLKRSADHFEAKHGLRVWNANVDTWLTERRRALGLEGSGQAPARPVDGGKEAVPASETANQEVGRYEPAEPRRPKIALLVDAEGWAFWNITEQLCRRLTQYEFRVLTVAGVDNVVQPFLVARDCDLVHVFWREYLNLLLTPHAEERLRWLGSDAARFRERVLRPRVISTCIYDHLHLDPDGLAARRPVFRDLVDDYYVGSRRLERIYADLPDWPAPAAVLEDGVDPERFYPVNLERLRAVGAAGERELVLGWTGNSRWSMEIEDFKGVATILRPAVEELRAEGLPVRLELADRAVSPPIPHAEMVHYYSRIDVYVCTSKIEGTPNPVLEAMACGVPIVSTDVGIVPDALGPRQHEFILPERSIAALKTALRRLLADPSLLPVLSAENLDSIRAWHWEHKAQGFARYFDGCLERRRARNTAVTA